MKYPFDCISEFIFVEADVEKSDVILILGASQSQLMERQRSFIIGDLLNIYYQVEE